MALVDPNVGTTDTPPAIVAFVPENLRVDPSFGATPPPIGTSSPTDTPPPVITFPGGVQVPIVDVAPWYSPAPAPAAAPPATPDAQATPAEAPVVAPPSPTAQTAPTVPPPFAQQDFPVQSPGAFVAPIGGAGIGGSAGHGLPGGGFLSINFPGGAWSGSSRPQLAAVPFAPHVAIRPGLGGIGRVLAGLGLAGPHRLPRELERHAHERTPLTP